MRLIDRIASRLTPYSIPVSGARTALVQSYTSGSAERVLPTFESYARDGYQSNGIVFSVILARLMLFSEARFKFRDLATKRIYGNPDLELLERPWPGGTTGELLARMEQDASLAGNAFIRNAGDQLERLRPDRVTIISAQRFDGVRLVLGYGYNRDGTSDALAEIFNVDEVAHWSPIPDPLADFRGMSWLTPVLREVDADQSMTTYKQAFFENAATPNLLIKYPPGVKFNRDQLDVLRDRWAARFAGPDNAWKTAVIDQGADVTVIGSNFSEMSFGAVQAAGENRIAAAGGVPAIVVGLKEGLDAATYSNYGLAMRRFSDVTMRPNWRTASSALSKLVPVPPGSELWYDTVDIAALQEGEKERAETSQVDALTLGELIRTGWTAESAQAAVVANDMSLLVHTGAIPTALYPDGQVPQGGTA